MLQRLRLVAPKRLTVIYYLDCSIMNSPSSMTEAHTQQVAQPLVEIASLKRLLKDTYDALTRQRELLLLRQLDLSAASLNSFGSLNSGLDDLETRLANEQTEIAQLRALVDNVALINSSLEIDTVLSQAMDVVIALTGAERGFIVLGNAQDDGLEFRVARQADMLGRSSSSNDPQLSQSLIRDVMASGKPLLADNAYKDERLRSASVAQLTLRSVLCVPMNYRGQILGVVYVDNRVRAGAFDQRELNLLAAFANLTAISLQNAGFYQEIQQAVSAITALKEMIDNVFESIGSGILTTDANDAIMTINSAAESILRKHRDSIIGEPIQNALHDFSDDLRDVLTQVRDSGEAQLVETELQVDEEERVAINLKLSPLVDQDGQRQGVTLVLDDITEQRERDETLNIVRRYLPPQLVDKFQLIANLDLGGERREVTCMYVDVRSLTSIPQGIRPAELMEIVNVYLAVATDCIHQTSGVIDKYMGQEIMALFNTQLNPMEDHAAMAVEAALLIEEAFAKVYEHLGLDTNTRYYRIGINTGVATLGNVGSLSRRDFSAIGDTINLAKRLEENAGMGQILIGEDTRRQLENSLTHPLKIAFQELEPIQVKGRQQQTRVYSISRMLPDYSANSTHSANPANSANTP
jgi:adenylate cyclase